MSIPCVVYNVVADQCYYTISLGNVHYPPTVVEQGHYKRMFDLIEAMHSEMPKDIFGTEFIKFTSTSGSIEMTFAEIHRYDLSIRCCESLANILGADADVAYNHANALTTREFSLKDGDVNSVYIYCDILEHVTVGDTKAPLLRIVDKPRKQYGNVHRNFNPILYVPLQKKEL